MKENLLALDIATNMGWRTHDGGGTVKFTAKNRLEELYWFLCDMEWAYDLEVIAVERIAGQHKNSLIVMAKMRGVVELFARRHGIQVWEYSPGTIKKSYTGTGRATKEHMVCEFRGRMNRNPIDDNEADAHAIFCLAEEEL